MCPRARPAPGCWRWACAAPVPAPAGNSALGAPRRSPCCGCQTSAALPRGARQPLPRSRGCGEAGQALGQHRQQHISIDLERPAAGTTVAYRRFAPARVPGRPYIRPRRSSQPPTARSRPGGSFSAAGDDETSYLRPTTSIGRRRLQRVASAEPAQPSSSKPRSALRW